MKVSERGSEWKHLSMARVRSTDKQRMQCAREHMIVALSRCIDVEEQRRLPLSHLHLLVATDDHENRAVHVMGGAYSYDRIINAGMA